MEAYVINPAGLAELIKDGLVCMVNCYKSDGCVVPSIPGAKLMNFNWNRDNLAQEISRLDIPKEQLIVTFESKGIEIAARMWWVLQTLGFNQVKVLNGGLEKWIEEYGSICEVEVKSPQSIAEFEVGILSSAIITRSELIETDPDSFTLLQTNAFQRLDEKLLNPNATLLPLPSLQAAMNEQHINLDNSKLLVVGGDWVGSILLILHALGRTNCKVLSDEGAQFFTKRTTVFYDIEDSDLLRNEFEDSDVVPKNTLSPVKGTQEMYPNRNTRFFSVLPIDSAPADGSDNLTNHAKPVVSKHYQSSPSNTQPSNKDRGDGQQAQCACLVF